VSAAANFAAAETEVMLLLQLRFFVFLNCSYFVAIAAETR
jgi:hypothetical protein